MKQEIIIHGAGISGVLTAWHLVCLGYKSVIFDPKGISGRSSGVPVALMNPLTGRNATMVWEYEKTLQLFNRILIDVPKCRNWVINGIIRLATTPEMVESFKNSYESNELAESGYDWLDTKELKRRIPVKGALAGIYIPTGYSVQLPQFLNELVNFLKSKGVQLVNHYPSKILNESVIVNATGDAFIKDKNWSFVPSHPIKGQIILIKRSELNAINIAVSSNGYVAPLNTANILIGSTFEHNFSDENPDVSGKNYLLNKYHQLFDDVSPVVTGLWSGIRTGTKDRYPVVGQHPADSKLFIAGGFGSKGLTYGINSTSYLAKSMINSEPIPQKIDLKRFL